MKQKQSGFSLIEILVTIIIVAILAALLTPVYNNYILKSNRSDAIRSLQNAQMLQEKYRVNNTSYGSLAQIGASTNSIGGLYTISTTNTAASTYTLNAVSTVGSTQTSDTACTNFTITYANGTTTLSSLPQTDCWSQ